MKKLTKKSLDELAKTMSVVDESEQGAFWGKYYNDCFWRCVAYISSGGTSFTEEAAASFAESFFSTLYGSYTEAYLTSLGAGMTQSLLREYQKTLQGTSLPASGERIVMFNTNNITAYEPTGTQHAAVLKSINSDGSYYIFDPQDNFYTTIPASQTIHVTYAY